MELPLIARSNAGNTESSFFINRDETASTTAGEHIGSLPKKGTALAKATDTRAMAATDVTLNDAGTKRARIIPQTIEERSRKDKSFLFDSAPTRTSAITEVATEASISRTARVP